VKYRVYKFDKVFSMRLSIISCGVFFATILYCTFNHPAGGWDLGTEESTRFIRYFFIAAVIPYTVLLGLTFTNIKQPKSLKSNMFWAVFVAFLGLALYGHGSGFFLLLGLLINHAVTIQYSINKWTKS